MNITKIKIRNLFGIKEYEQDGSSIELSGKNGIGKTSVIDAIRYALTNKSTRKYVVHKGETEGEIIVETDNGITIDRKARTNAADYKSIKRNGLEVNGPEAFLKDIFTPLQLNPVEFMSMSEKEQNSIILDMLEYHWTLDDIKAWFGEIPAWVSYDQNILAVLNDIQSESGEYYQNRRNIDRDIRNKKAFVEEIAATIPDGYEVDKWENAHAGDIYAQIERQLKENQQIERAKSLIENRDNKVRKFEADKEIAVAALEREINTRSGQIDKDIASLNEQIRALEVERDGLAAKKADKMAVIDSDYKASMAKFDAEVEEYKDLADKAPNDVTELQAQAKTIEDMQSHINEYKRMMRMQDEIAEMGLKSQSLTEKIEKARSLPGEILAECTIPIEGLTVENGVPLINGLPVSNLSDGEKLDLCIDVAIQNPNGLSIILIDGVEKLSSGVREKLYAKCKEKGLQFISTRTTDADCMEVIEL